MKVERWIIHPVLFSVYPVLFYYSHNAGQIRFEDVIKPLAIVFILAILGWGLLRLIIRDWYRAGAIVSLFFLLFFSYGHAKSNIDVKVGIDLLPLAWVLILVLGAMLIIKSKNHFISGTKILNAASLIMLTLVFINIGIFHTKSYGYDHKSLTNRVLDGRGHESNSETYPDIYFIVLDAYARQDVLDEIYGYDNSEFIGFLENHGFYVADKAVANYGQTGLSLASCLNLDYLEEVAETLGKKNQSRAPLARLIQQSRATNFLKDRGYKIVAFLSPSSEPETKNADVLLKSGITVNQIHTGLINTTPIPDIMESKAGGDGLTRYRKHTYFMFDNLGKVASEYENPKFVFAHFDVPHPPFLFGPDGEPIQLESRVSDHDGNWLIRKGRLSVQQYRDHYRDQVKFVNKRIKDAIEEILANSSEPPILIIFSDHGPRSGLVWESVERTDVKESLTILNAFHLPGNGSELLYPGISPVNTFRVIFNHYFGADLELLPDESYFSTARYLYEFYNVTDRVNQ